MDFDLSSLLSNPMFQVGVGLLGSKGNNVAQNMQMGLQNANAAAMNPLQQQIFKLQAQRLQNAMNFNPADFMQTSPNPVGTNESLNQAMGQLPSQTPATLGGPIGSQTSMPGANPSQISLNPASGTPNGNIDFPSLVSAGLKAGFNPGDIGMIAQSMAPQYYARLQAMVKGMEPYTLAPGAMRVNPMEQGPSGGGITQNTNAPPESKLGQITALTNARDQARAAGNEALANQLDAAINEVSGAVSQDRMQQMLGIAKENLGLHRESIEGNPQDIENTAAAIANYQMAPLSGFGLRSPGGQRVMARVMEMNPNYNAQEYTTSQKAYSDFATGKNGNIVRSQSVALDHLATLGGLVGALNNGDVQAVNRLGNVVAAQTGKTAPTNFDAAKSIVGDEIVKAIVGAGGGVSDRQEMKAILDKANSPQQLAGVIQTYQKLLAGQLGGLQRQYEQATHRQDFSRLLSPAAQDLMSGKEPKTVTRTGTINGRRVYQYSDGTTAYAE